MVKVAVPALARLLPKPGETLSRTGEKMPKIGMAQMRPSRSSTLPRPWKVRQSLELARAMVREPLMKPSRFGGAELVLLARGTLGLLLTGMPVLLLVERSVIRDSRRALVNPRSTWNSVPWPRLKLKLA